MSLRIGTLTFHRVMNYGSYWQARCLVEALRQRGHQAEIIDHDSPAKRTAEWRLALRPTLPTPVPPEDVPAYDRKVRRFQRLISELPLSRCVPLDHVGELEPYDVVVIGSDEVWNLRHGLYGGDPAFFGVGLPAKRRIAYAASFGNYSSWEGLGSPWPEILSDLDAISVRDENSWWMLKHALGVEPPLVLDPTLLHPPAPRSDRRSDEPYALVYGHNFSESFVTKTRAWAKDNHLRLLSIGYRNDWADEQWLDADPLDFNDAVAGAEAIATNFFHGCVFSLIHERPFACETSDYRSIKVRGLMEAVGGESHLIREETPEDPFCTVMCEPIDPTIARRIGNLRADSNRYLDEALK